MNDTSVIRQAVEEYVSVSNQITKASKELSDVRRQKTELGELILTFLTNNDSDSIVPKNGDVQLIKKESVRTEGIKKQHIINALRGTGIDPDKILEEIESQRLKKTKDVLSTKKLKHR